MSQKRRIIYMTDEQWATVQEWASQKGTTASAIVRDGVQTLIYGRTGLREALTTIRDQYGQVCDNFELCDHRACRASYSAWHVADAALAATTQVVKLQPKGE